MGSYTDDPMLVKIIQAEHVYRLFGKSVWPWEIDEIVPEDWLDAIETIAVEVPNRKPNG